MTEPDTPADRKSTDDSADTSTTNTIAPAQSRRRLLQTLTLGSSMALSGCKVFQSSTPNGSGGQRGSGQTFRLPTENNPATASFYAPGFGEALDSAYAVTPKEPASGRLWRFIREPGVWIDYWWVGANSHYAWLDTIEITPTEVTVTLQNDATWSDGHPMTGKDVAVYPLSQLLWRHFPPYYATDEKEEPTAVLGAFDDFDISDRSVTYRSSQGYFDQFWDMTINTRFGLWGMAGDAAFPTHVEPYDAFADGLIETASRAQAGEINPWEGYRNPFAKPEDPHRESLVEKHLAKEGKYVAKFSRPDHVVSNSAWDLVEIEGPEAVFEPNPHHRNVETINFERVILEHTPSAEREHAALKADRLDYAGGFHTSPTPQSVVDSLPDNITQLLIPGNLWSGNELGLNFTHVALRKRSFRAAIMYALDHSVIANNIHQHTAKPVTTPGGDCWDTTDYASEAWIGENFITYTHDRDRAASLMREAGYSKDGEQWIDSDGEPISLTLATDSATPRWEPTVAGQLSQFGIETGVKQFSETTYENRVDHGAFPMWSHVSAFTTNFAAETLVFWFFPIIEYKRYEIYPPEQFNTGSFSRDGYPTPRTEDRWSAFSIEAPPMGKPDGNLETYHPSALVLAFYNDPPAAEFRRRVKTAMWLANWFLPTIPINKTMQQHFIDDAHWNWPVETPQWETYTNAGPRIIEGVFGSGAIRANPDNPED